MAAVDWPKVPFYLLSQLNWSDLVVFVNENGFAQLEPLTGTADQLWVATPDVRGGARLTNLLSGLALYGQPLPGTSNGDVNAAPVDLSAANGCWVLDNFPSDGWMRIQCLPPSTNWWLTSQQDLPGFTGGGLGLSGWNGGQFGEFQVMPETGGVTVTDIKYTMANAKKNLSVPPVDFLAVVVDNTRGNVPLTQTISLTGSIEQSTDFQTEESNTEGTVYTQSFEVKTTIGPVEVTASGSFEENQSTTVGWSNGTTNTQTWTNNIQTEAAVPARKKYSFHQRVNYGQVTVPYTATGTFQSCVPDTQPHTFQMTGTFTGLNAMTAEVIVADITPAQPGSAGHSQVVRSVRMPLSSNTAKGAAP